MEDGLPSFLLSHAVMAKTLVNRIRRVGSFILAPVFAFEDKTPRRTNRAILQLVNLRHG